MALTLNEAWRGKGGISKQQDTEIDTECICRKKEGGFSKG
jgi:hypothetical protein